MPLEREVPSDWFESQVGWLAGPVGPGGPAAWRVYSDPSSCDGDADMSADGPTNHQSMCDPGSLLLDELRPVTDPNNANTDGDRDDSGAPWLDGPATVTDLSFKYDPAAAHGQPLQGAGERATGPPARSRVAATPATACYNWA